MSQNVENIAKDPFTEEAAYAQSAWPAYLGGSRVAWNREQYLALVAEVAAERAAKEAEVSADTTGKKAK
jgi:hypothetical protein